ncbi:MAG: Sensor histidine kinase LiaS [Luteibacter sp.]|uniref:sensor histidine kinase n=1 Tax=Luteibacter sp. TaxID=1886636 RepID=UPI00137FCE82|nr:7TM diverse intracellular signaling domain-containing protein [Luteibacter sp.]KAF1007237.1 MAG: Sensor histidine kinase LiaS [Luteibacter sp.]
MVWYRLHWDQDNTDRPTALLVNYVSLASAMYVNGSLVYRDPQLVEPLSRSWTKPRYFLLDKPLLRQGRNTLLVRVSGLAAYQPGFGTVEVGDPAVVHPRFLDGVRWRYDLQMLDQMVTLVFGGLFGIIWLLRRKDSSYGWYALSTLLSFVYGLNYTAESIWPLPSTDAWEAVNAAAYLAAGSSFAVFLLRYVDRRWPRVEWGLLAINLVSFAAVIVAPTPSGIHRGWWFAVGGLIYYAATFGFAWHAVHKRRTDHLVLSACLMIPLLVSIHDFLLYYGVIRSDRYLLAVTSPLTVVGMGFALAYRFAVAMRRVEGFNLELKQEVDAATRQLGDTLTREHSLAIENLRIGERLNLVRDLHDGFGGSLVGAITSLERAPPSPVGEHTIAVLRELRDDLRLIVDTTTYEQATDLASFMATFRHRWDQRLELANIDSQWQLDGLDGLYLGPARSLDLMRFLQEALTNVLKHSRARHATTAIVCDRGRLRIAVSDDGVGFDEGRKTTGAGLASLRARATRLNGAFQRTTAPGQGVSLSLDMPA